MCPMMSQNELSRGPDIPKQTFNIEICITDKALKITAFDEQ